MKIARARLDTSHFSFEAFAPDEESARIMLARTWMAHCNEYGGRADRNYLSKYQDDIMVDVIEMDAGYRDNEKIIGGEEE